MASLGFACSRSGPPLGLRLPQPMVHTKTCRHPGRPNRVAGQQTRSRPRIGRPTALFTSVASVRRSPAALRRPSGERGSFVHEPQEAETIQLKSCLAGKFRPPRRPLPNRLPCGTAIVVHEARSPAVSGDVCRLWAVLQVRLGEDGCQPQLAPVDRRPPGRRHVRRLQPFTEMEQGFSGTARAQ